MTAAQIAQALPQGVTVPRGTQRPQTAQNRVPMPQNKPGIPQFSQSAANQIVPYGGYARGGRPAYAGGGTTVANSAVAPLTAADASAYPTLPAAIPLSTVSNTPQPYSNVVANVPLSALSGGDGSNGIVASVNGMGIPSGSPGTPITSTASPLTITPDPNISLDLSLKGGGKIPQFANGGFPSASEAAPWFVRHGAEPVHTGGLFGGSAPGRADTLPISVPVNSHVIPIDAVAAIGQGNSLSGGNILTGMFHSGPMGLPLEKGRGAGMSIPRAPVVRTSHESTGGRKMDHGRPTVPIAASSGEFLVHPIGVYKTGLRAAMNMRLDPRKLTPKKVFDIGHDTIDKFILKVRAKEIKDAKNRPAPKKD